MDGAQVGLCLPIRSMAARLATLPRTASFASITCQARTISCLDGISVRMDRLLLSARKLEHFSLTNLRFTCQRKGLARAHEVRFCETNSSRLPFYETNPGRRSGVFTKRTVRGRAFYQTNSPPAVTGLSHYETNPRIGFVFSSLDSSHIG